MRSSAMCLRSTSLQKISMTQGVSGAAPKTSRTHSATHRVLSCAPNQSQLQDQRRQSALGWLIALSIFLKIRM